MCKIVLILYSVRNSENNPKLHNFLLGYIFGNMAVPWCHYTIEMPLGVLELYACSTRLVCISSSIYLLRKMLLYGVLSKFQIRKTVHTVCRSHPHV